MPAAVLALASGLLVSCTPPLESDWRRIDRLESRLGTIETLDEGDALQARPATPVPSSNADDVAQVEGL
ncbi:MAG: hypothetical protein VYD99_03705, partial [Planctomycetota bacterium]|nr:hypothetical protein [Planctomycetota bacterium]